MAHLILHIGAHKTGTTSVQHYFHANAAALLRRGVAYPPTGHLKAHYVLAAPWIGEMEKLYGFTAEDGRAAWCSLDQHWARFEGTVFLSAEAFCHRMPDRVDFRELAELSHRFDSVEIVYVAREQVAAIQSVYMEITRHRPNAPSLARILDAVLHEPDIFPISFDHRDMFDQVEAAFRPEQIRFLSYDRLRRTPGGVIGYFCQLCGVQVPAEMVRENISADPLSHYLAATACHPAPVSPETIAQCRAALERVHGANIRTTMFSRSEIEQLHQAFEPANRMLLTRIAPQGGLEADLELSRFENHLARDELSPEAHAEISRSA